MNETNQLLEYVWIAILLAYLVPFIVLFVVFIEEMILLRKTEWVERSRSITYPLLTLVCCFIVGVVLIVIHYIVVMFSSLVGAMLFSSIFGELGPLVYTFALLVVFFFVNWAVFLGTRLLARQILVKGSELTWKYDLVHAFILAVFFLSNTFATFLMQTVALFSYGTMRM